MNGASDTEKPVSIQLALHHQGGQLTLRSTLSFFWKLCGELRLWVQTKGYRPSLVKGTELYYSTIVLSSH